MNHGLHHVHKRKVSYLSPSENTPTKKFLDKMAFVVAFIGPFALLDQAIKIWQQQSSENVSILIWVILIFTGSFWMLYGIVHKEKAIFIAHFIQFSLSVLILSQIFYYTFIY